MTKKIVLFERQEDCCGCGACANRCPKGAIQMQRDEFGFLYPIIQDSKCVGCGLCKTTCGFQKKNEAPLLPTAAFAVQAKDERLLKRSASGGLFAVLAQATLEAGGAVAGCALVPTEDGLVPYHILIEALSELEKLQGSKYVQSVTGDIYRQVRDTLETGRQVLFSGTPCQVDGLNGYLGRSYPNLLTVDIICHGTPNDAFFRDYLRFLEKKYKGTVIDFKFREKSGNWGGNREFYCGSVTFRNKNGNEQKSFFPSGKSSYYKLFLGAESFRSSCYHCKYACLSRPGDLTIGDFWGIETQHPDYLTENGGSFSTEKGVSCLLVNSGQGGRWLDLLSSRADVKVSDPQAVACGNRQLNHPSTPGKHRDKVLWLYRDSGYPAVKAWFVWHRFFSSCTGKLHSLWKRIFPHTN